MQNSQTIHHYNDLETAIEKFFVQISTGYGKGNGIAGIAECLAEVLEFDDLEFLADAISKEIAKNKSV